MRQVACKVVPPPSFTPKKCSIFWGPRLPRTEGGPSDKPAAYKTNKVYSNMLKLTKCHYICDR